METSWQYVLAISRKLQIGAIALKLTNAIYAQCRAELFQLSLLFFSLHLYRHHLSPMILTYQFPLLCGLSALATQNHLTIFIANLFYSKILH